jgi:multidrug efflux pump subunit AcrB
VELSISVPLEEEILEVDGLKKVYSASMEGISVLTLRLDPEVTDKAQSLADIQKAVDRASARLPQDLLEKPLVEEMSSLQFPVMELHLVGQVPEEILRREARKLTDTLREVEGIAGVEKIGYRRREVRVFLDPARMQQLGIPIASVQQAIRARNVRDSAGSLESFVAEKKVLTVGQFRDPREVEQVIVRSPQPGNTVRLSDIGRVVLDYEDWQVQSRTDGRLSIALLPHKKANADGLDTSRRVREVVQGYRSGLPPGVELVMVNDISRFTYDMLNTLSSNAAIGFVLVFLTLWAFLRLRLAVWVSVGLPVALLLTVAVMPLFGLGIDMLTMMGLILVLGMVVDDAIVAAESVEQERERGASRFEAVVEGVSRVAAPVIVSTLTTVLAFAPVAFLGGLEGKFLWTFPAMVALVLLASLFECLCLLPSHLSHGGSHQPPPPKAWLVRVQDVYDRLIRRIIRRRYLSIALFVTGFGAILGFGALTMTFNLYPELEIDTVNFKIELPEGASFAYTVEKAAELETLVRSEVPGYDLLNITTRIGHHDTDPYGATEGRNPAWGLLTLFMQPQGQRRSNTRALVAQLREAVKRLEGYKSIIVEPIKDTPVAGKPVELEIIGNDTQRYAVSDVLQDYLRSYPGVTEVWTSYKPGKDLVELVLDHPALASRGLSVADVTTAVRVAFDGLIVEQLQTVDERIYYRLQLPPEDRGRMQTLENLAIVNAARDPIYLRSLARLESRPGESAIKHYRGQRTLTLYADIDRAITSVQQVNDDLAAYVRNEALLQKHPQVRLWLGGELEQQRESLGDIGTAFAACVLTVFVVLVLLFNSLTQPFLILLAIPFGLAGVVVGFSLQGLPLSLIALIGLLGLIGVLVNDSLVMVHSLNRIAREQNAPLSDEQLASGAGRRLRPILITSLTTVAGLFPTAYGLAGSNPFITPMVMAMAWGILFGTVISLLLLPCLYAADRDIKTQWARLRRVRPRPVQ